MTVLAFDGKTLAADKQSGNNCHIATLTKIFRCTDGSLIALVGGGAHAMRLKHWALADHFDPARFPVENSDERAHLWRVTPGGRISCYQNNPFALEYEDTTFVDGIGRGYAAGALEMGADAKRAVEIACKYSTECGQGVDTLELVAQAATPQLEAAE